MSSTKIHDMEKGEVTHLPDQTSHEARHHTAVGTDCK
jgi:hypothetical protein